MQAHTSARWVFLLALTLLVFFSSSVETLAAGKTKHLDYAESKGVTIPEPPPDKALVVFLRPEAKGHAVHSSLYVDEAFLGFVHKDTCFIYEAEPGQHEFMVLGETAKFMDAELDAGKIYFVKVKVQMGMVKARFAFAPITEGSKEWSKLPKWLATAYRVEPNDSARKWYEAKQSSIETKRAQSLPNAKRVVLAAGNGVTSY